MDENGVRNSVSTGGITRSPFKPVALRPRHRQPQAAASAGGGAGGGGAFEATAPYSSIFSRRQGDDERTDSRVAGGGDVGPPGLSGGICTGRESVWTPRGAAAGSAAAVGDAGSSVMAEPGSAGVMSPTYSLMPRRSVVGVREEGPAAAAAVPPPSPPLPGGDGGGVTREGTRGEGSEVGSSSTSTLPPLDQELTELLER